MQDNLEPAQPVLIGAVHEKGVQYLLRGIYHRGYRSYILRICGMGEQIILGYLAWGYQKRGDVRITVTPVATRTRHINYFNVYTV